MKNTSIIERIEYAAQNGVYEIPLYVGTKQPKNYAKKVSSLLKPKSKMFGKAKVTI